MSVEGASTVFLFHFGFVLSRSEISHMNSRKKIPVLNRVNSGNRAYSEETLTVTPLRVLGLVCKSLFYLDLINKDSHYCWQL